MAKNLDQIEQTKHLILHETKATGGNRYMMQAKDFFCPKNSKKQRVIDFPRLTEIAAELTSSKMN